MDNNIFTNYNNNDDTVTPNKKSKYDWVDESFLLNNNQQDEYLTPNFDLKKLRWIFIGVIVLFGIISFRTAFLQVVKGDEYREAAEENRIRITEIKAPRGIIYDRHGTALTHNIPNFVLSFVPGDLPENDDDKTALLNQINQILQTDIETLWQTINEAPAHTFKSYVLQDHIPYEKALLLRIATSDLPGFNISISTFREYISSQYFSHILGYMGKITEQEIEEYPGYSYDDYLGKSGIELYYEDTLRGEHGKKEIEVNSLGKESKIITETEPVSGTNVVLTIDSDLQNTLGQAIDDLTAQSNSITGAAAIAMDPNNGQILALASAPSFDSNRFTLGLSSEEYNEVIKNPKQPLFNRAISGEYPSGSTIKPLIALAGLEEGVITDKTTVLSTGGIRIGQWFFPDWKAGGHGVTDVRKAIAESVNTFFYAVGGGYEDIEGLGVSKIKSYLELFGLNSNLGIDLPGESSGFLPTKEWKKETKGENWYIGDTYHLSIGQGDLLVTPLQVANYTSIIANGGTYYQPTLLHSYTDSKNNILENNNPEIIRNNFIEKQYYQDVQQGLRDGVLYGSSISLSNLPFSVAGKTGTAQFNNQDDTHAWFTCYAPYENPEIVITVMVENGGEGHATALPIARQGLLNWFNHE